MLVFAALAGFAWAGVPARANGATLLVNDVAVLTIKTGSGTFTPERRAEIAAEAISDSDLFQVTLSREPAYALVKIGERKVLSIDATEAKAHKASIDDFAEQVVEKLNGALSAVPFVLSQKKVWMPVGGTAQIQVLGPKASKAYVTFDDRGPAKATKDDQMITLTAEYVGECKMTVNLGELRETISVNVMMPAAEIGPVPTAYVTGRPADKETVADAATRAVLQALKTTPDATVSVTAVSAPQLVPAQRGTARVHAVVRAPGKYPVDKDLDVDLKNSGMLDVDSEELWYSNDPERITKPERLYWGRLAAGKAARVLYHHVNATNGPMLIRYMLINLSDETARVAVTLGDAPPHENPTYAGYMAGQEFFPRWERQSAFVVELQPHSVVPVVLESLDPKKTASGLMALHSLDGPSVLFIGDAKEDTDPRGIEGNYAQSSPAIDFSEEPINLVGTAQHVYSPATKKLSVDYVVGKRFGYIRIGQVPVKRLDDDGGLDGNFGVVYQIETTISNPTSEPVDVEYVFEASAGYGGAFFRINGLVERTPLLQPKATYRLLRVTLAPGEKKSFYLETIPLSGGSYPVTVTIKPVGVD